MSDLPRWRVGRHYNIHVYEDERPVATFHTAVDAKRCVDAVNRLAREEPKPRIRRVERKPFILGE